MPKITFLHFFALVLTMAIGACGVEEGGQRQDAGQKPQIVASFVPVAMIAREVAGDSAEVHTLVTVGDPHHYAPNVADRAAMERAQLVIWMGPAMESVLARQMALLPAGKQLSLAQAPGYEFDGSDEKDPHLWLRPRNAAVMAAHIATRLAALDPEQAEGYRQRARDFSRQMANFQKVQDRALWAYRDSPVVTTHLAYSQFFGPAGVAARSLSGNASHQHGARVMLEHSVGQGAEQGNRGCLFGEVPANDRDRQTAAHLGLGYRALDPLGINLPANADYRQLMQKLLADARECLGSIPDTTGTTE